MTSFVTENAERFGVEPICRVLTEHGVPIAPSTFYAARSRPPSARAVRDEVVLAEIRRVHADPLIGRGVFGARKVFHALARAGGVEGLHVPRCQVERLMRADGLAGARRGRVFRTTRPDDAAARPPDLVNRDVSAPAPNRLRLVDSTYVPTWAGMAFTAFVTDAYSRRIVGWRTAPSMPTDLPLDALEMALWTRERAGHEVTGVIQHSDAGSQYTAIRYQARLADAGALASIGTVGDSYGQRPGRVRDRALQDRVHQAGRTLAGRDDLELATLGWVHWFNEHRLHSSIGHVPPIEYEQAYYRQINSSEQTLAGVLALH